MSVKQSSIAWGIRGLQPTCKLVLLALADNANDDGICFPSIRNVSGKSEVSPRTVQRHINFLEEIGYIHRHLRFGKSTIYTLTLENNPRQNVTPIKSKDSIGGGDSDVTPDTSDTPVMGDVLPLTPMSPTYDTHVTTPLTPVSPITIIETSKKRQLNSDQIKAVDLPEWLERDLWEKFVDYRKLIKHPITINGVRGVITAFKECMDSGESIESALERMAAHSWRVPYKKNGGTQGQKEREESNTAAADEALKYF